MNSETVHPPNVNRERADEARKRRQHRARLDASAVKRLRTVHPLRFLAKLVLLFLLLAANSYAILATEDVARLGFQIVQGVLFAHGVELVHQCLHKTATRKIGVDHVLGMILGWPVGVSFYFYLFWHFYHHAHNGTEEDQESFGYAYNLLQSPSRLIRVLGLLYHLSQAGHYWTTIRWMALAVPGLLRGQMKAATPTMPDKIAGLIQRDYRIMVGLLMTLIAASLLCRISLFLYLWLVPVLVGYGWSHALIELPEHFGCDHPSGNTFTNTRSIRASWFGSWLTNFNAFHVGHHDDPLVPMDCVPEYERLLMIANEFKYLEESYPRFYLRFIRYIWTGKSD